MQQNNELCSRIILRVGDKFKFNIPTILRGVEYMFCGFVDVDGKMKSLCHKKYLKEEEKANEYCLLSLNYFSSGLRKDIEIIKQNEAQFEASRRIARKRRKKWIDENIQQNSNRNRPKL
mgnify:CR=1 FL=1